MPTRPHSPPAARRLRLMAARSGVILAAWIGSASLASCATAQIHSGACDASAVSNLGGGCFAAASDESNTLRIYRLGGGPARQPLPVGKFLDAFRDGEEKESDIEGATRIGDTILWITSHGRNPERKERPERQRLFATKVEGSGETARLVKPGGYYSRLLDDLKAAPQLAAWPIEAASSEAPQASQGLNIESLCATPSGAVWVGFRNPIRNGRALLVEIKNPIDLVKGAASKAIVGKVRELALGGRGLRDMAPWRDGYLLLAGAFDNERRFALFRWNGGDDPPVELPIDLNATKLNPEGLLVTSDGVFVLSDDDSLPGAGDKPNSEMPEEQRTFRSLRVMPPK